MPYVGSFDSIYIQEAVFERNQVDFQRNDDLWSFQSDNNRFFRKQFTEVMQNLGNRLLVNQSKVGFDLNETKTTEIA